MTDVGLSTTEELLNELACRMDRRQNSDKGRELGRLCLDALDNLDGSVLLDRGVVVDEPDHGPSGMDDGLLATAAEWAELRAVARIILDMVEAGCDPDATVQACLAVLTNPRPRNIHDR